MKNKLTVIIVLIFCQISSNVQSEMTERQIFTELFLGCVNEGDPNMTIGVQFEYCACVISNISTGLTYDELMDFVEDNQKATTNNKLAKFSAKCIEQAYK